MMINKSLFLTYLYLFIYILLSSGVILYNKVTSLHLTWLLNIGNWICVPRSCWYSYKSCYRGSCLLIDNSISYGAWKLKCNTKLIDCRQECFIYIDKKKAEIAVEWCVLGHVYMVVWAISIKLLTYWWGIS